MLRKPVLTCPLCPCHLYFQLPQPGCLLPPTWPLVLPCGWSFLCNIPSLPDHKPLKPWEERAAWPTPSACTTAPTSTQQAAGSPERLVAKSNGMKYLCTWHFSLLMYSRSGLSTQNSGKLKARDDKQVRGKHLLPLMDCGRPQSPVGCTRSGWARWGRVLGSISSVCRGHRAARSKCATDLPCLISSNCFVLRWRRLR